MSTKITPGTWGFREAVSGPFSAPPRIAAVFVDEQDRRNTVFVAEVLVTNGREEEAIENGKAIASIPFLLARIAALERCVGVAIRLRDHARKLTAVDRWADGDHLMIHSDGMLDLEGLCNELDAARAEVYK